MRGSHEASQPERVSFLSDPAHTKESTKGVIMPSTSVRIAHDQLILGPVRVSFLRTLRIPEAGLHPLPPGLGHFPLRRVEDYPATAPGEWLERGG